MSGRENIEATKRGYAAFAAANLDEAMKVFDDDIEWVQPGHSAVSGTYHGKGEVAELLTKFATKTFSSTPKRFVADDDVVIVLTDVTIEGESSVGADVYTFRDGKVVKAETFGDTALMERVFGAS